VRIVWLVSRLRAPARGIRSQFFVDSILAGFKRAAYFSNEIINATLGSPHNILFASLRSDSVNDIADACRYAVNCVGGTFGKGTFQLIARIPHIAIFNLGAREESRKSGTDKQSSGRNHQWILIKSVGRLAAKFTPQ